MQSAPGQFNLEHMMSVLPPLAKIRALEQKKTHLLKATDELQRLCTDSGHRYHRRPQVPVYLIRQGSATSRDPLCLHPPPNAASNPITSPMHHDPIHNPTHRAFIPIPLTRSTPPGALHSPDSLGGVDDADDGQLTWVGTYGHDVQISLPSVDAPEQDTHIPQSGRNPCILTRETHRTRMEGMQMMFRLAVPHLNTDGTLSQQPPEPNQQMLNQFWGRISQLLSRDQDPERRQTRETEIKNWNRENRQACLKCAHGKARKACIVDENSTICRPCRQFKLGCDRRQRFLFDMTKNEFFSDYEEFLAVYRRKITADTAQFRDPVRIPQPQLRFPAESTTRVLMEVLEDKGISEGVRLRVQDLLDSVIAEASARQYLDALA
ncbi:hypothetical protein MSAN_01911600 [Mycena sanguinolenta]|uniref:Uncharacterized protein n=1 Tax=Mycena sanguinolenta TaxID=230812 RepID=A0A8H6XRP4_9AGAR|nr:hypothetical protein MSAN_01911600 [Mycena sanguinolenta]